MDVTAKGNAMDKVKAFFRSLRRSEKGQGMTEYIIIVALIAIAAISVVTIFGDNLRALFGTSANALAGQPSTLEGLTVEEDDIKKDLSTFGGEP